MKERLNVGDLVWAHEGRLSNKLVTIKRFMETGEVVIEYKGQWDRVNPLTLEESPFRA